MMDKDPAVSLWPSRAGRSGLQSRQPEAGEGMDQQQHAQCGTVGGDSFLSQAPHSKLRSSLPRSFGN